MNARNATYRSLHSRFGPELPRRGKQEGQRAAGDPARQRLAEVANEQVASPGDRAVGRDEPAIDDVDETAHALPHDRRRRGFKG